jgi:hypothetical protein
MPLAEVINGWIRELDDWVEPPDVVEELDELRTTLGTAVKAARGH